MPKAQKKKKEKRNACHVQSFVIWKFKQKAEAANGSNNNCNKCCRGRCRRFLCHSGNFEINKLFMINESFASSS